ncbi:MAG: hypothetical protein JWQ75_1322 [Pseudarthrobacter sp.]|nr:hypothetical protein [Pseudarthrobacter sp.]
MTLRFEYAAPRQRVFFGSGNAAADVSAEAARLPQVDGDLQPPAERHHGNHH